MQLIEGYSNAREALLKANAKRRLGADPAVEEIVRTICEAVRDEGDAALLRYEREFDCPTLEREQLRVTATEMDEGWSLTSAEARRALERAAASIEEFHSQQPIGNWTSTSHAGVTYGQRYTPIERVAMYAPGGRAVYPSTVLMLAVPAAVAGVPQRVLATPPARDGRVAPVLLAAAQIAGITEIYKMGGAPAVAALAYGTASVPAVDKIVGPGNAFVTLAKRYVFGTVGIDGFYGPSEVVILAILGDGANDKGGVAAQVAADLLAQAEHGPDSFVALVTTSRSLAEAVLREIEKQGRENPRLQLIEESLHTSLLLCVSNEDDACALVDLAAAEHVEIWGQDAESLSARISHAGAVFLNTPVPLGDYIAGPSHTLPTGGTARFMHGVGVDTFLKRTSLISATQQAVASCLTDLEVLTGLESLPAHGAAVRLASS